MKAASAQTDTITIHVPIQFTTRGGRKTVLSELTAPPPQPRIDNALFKALARAHRWRQLIEDGSYASITELAKVQCVNESYACRLLRLTLLAPDVIVSILNDRSDIMLKDLLKPQPQRWEHQMKALMLGARR
jgi:hypothetical protein